MPTGDKSYMGLALPLNGEAEMRQVVSGNDLLTLTGVTGNSGSFFVIQDNSGTDIFKVESSGDVSMPAGNYLNMGLVTSAPTTGLTKGDLFIAFTVSTPKIGICYSTAANSIRYMATRSKSFASLTN